MVDYHDVHWTTNMFFPNLLEKKCIDFSMYIKSHESRRPFNVQKHFEQNFLVTDSRNLLLRIPPCEQRVFKMP